MNRIVRERYPVSKLPDDLRDEFAGQDEVTVTVEAKPVPNQMGGGTKPLDGRGHFSRFRHLAKARYTSTDEVVAHVRALRDDWDEREQELNKLRGS